MARNFGFLLRIGSADISHPSKQLIRSNGFDLETLENGISKIWV